MAEMRTLLIQKADGNEFQIDIPVTYKVTFGPAFVGNTESKALGKISMALRIYETDKVQLAIFTDIVGFRDMAIPIRVKEIKIQEKDGFMECDGIRKRTTFQAKTHNWVNPDREEEEDKPKLLGMPQDVELFGEKTEE